MKRLKQSVAIGKQTKKKCDFSLVDIGKTHLCFQRKPNSFVFPQDSFSVLVQDWLDLFPRFSVDFYLELKFLRHF